MSRLGTIFLYFSGNRYNAGSLLYKTFTMASIEYINIPKAEYIILKSMYELTKKQKNLGRMYEVEENLRT